MNTFADIFAAFGGPTKLAKAIGLRAATHATTMKWRGSIPPQHWPRLIQAAEERGIEGVSYETLHRLHERVKEAA